MIHYRVQHALGRDEPLTRLIVGMPAGVEIVTDHQALTDPNPWRNYRRCLSDVPEEANHLVVVQDDAVVCRNFGAVVECLVKARPDDVLSLFVGGVARTTARQMYEAMKLGKSWTPLWFRDIAHVVALIWPVAAATEFLAWSDTARLPGYPRLPRSDDAIFGEWLRQTRRTVWATVPSLVEHPDDVPTLIHQRERARGGEDSGRVAVAWIGQEADPLAIDWTA